MKTNPRKFILLIGILFLGMILAGCGQKGPLRHPDSEPKQTIEFKS